ncbi:TlpA family protein disulfide reductase [Rhodopseudomonas palustris]|uniref:TlpA family protein disulfide reductase n=1 Tax=Thiospirillum jenense TaxID=1653858 RepID=A0A839HEH8_9GAMM|nr:TlpA disulfide reductase family protein [Thiospirillum jenense]MBB1089730.1 TlpA family protein disulfide reductase [Rhodopseudomonas palustris]MBB1124832.1 TlpA family protein disulfide reductase [Thiospirillum jenense]
MSVIKVVAATALAGGLSIGIALYGQQWFDGQFGTSGDRSSVRLTSLPDIRLPDVNGREVRSSSWAGKVLILHYWASWCAACVTDTQLLAQVQQQYGAGALQVVGIAIDQPQAVNAFLLEQPLPYPILIGGNAAAELSQQLGNRTLGLPFTVMFDAMGRRVFSHSGELTLAQVTNELARLVPVKK